MKNLKRALSLALASVMVLGLMMVGASAKSFDDFSDKDKIVNAEAVSILNNLNVINGKDDGSFDPTGIVTRAEMAKMICVVLNGGKDPQLGSVNSNTYSDTAGNWAAAYIEYCTTLGIVGGDGTGKFNPSNTVTGAEAAKMLLVAIGYNATYEKMVGAQWAMAVDVLANSNKLYNGLNINPAEGLSRDNAAQMVYNALSADMVKYTNALVTGADGSLTSIATVSKLAEKGETKTLLTERFGAVKVEGIVMENEYARLGTADKSLDAGKTVINITNGEEIDITGLGDGNATFSVASGADMLGRSVSLYLKPYSASEKNTEKGTVIGSLILSTDNKVVTDTTKDKLVDVADDNNLDIVSGTVAYAQYGAKMSVAKDAAGTRGVERTLIDNDGDGEVDIVLYTTYNFGKVTKYSTKDDGSITVKTNLTNLFEKDDKDDVVGFDDVEKDDYVLAAEIGGKLYVEKAETVTGELTGYKAGDSLTVDGTKYTVSGLAGYKDSGITSNTPGAYTDTDVEATFYLDKAGYIVAVGEAESSADSYALVIGASYSTLNKTADVKVALSDGTTGTYTLTKKTGTAGDGVTNMNVGDLVGHLYTYSINSSDEITLKDATQAKLGEHDNLDAVAGYVFDKGKSTILVEGTKKVYADKNTVFFYVTTDEENGDIKAIDKVNTYVGIDRAPSVSDNVKSYVFFDGSDAKAVVVYDGAAANTTDYMFIYDYLGSNGTGDRFSAIIDGELKEEVQMNDTESHPKDLIGTAQSYIMDGDNYEFVSGTLKQAEGYVSRVTDKSMVIDGVEYGISNNTTVATIDGDKTDKSTVSEDDYVVVVYNNDDDKDADGIYILTDDDKKEPVDELKAIAVSSDNTTSTVTGTLDPADATKKVTIDEVKKGDKITVKVTSAANQDITLTVGDESDTKLDVAKDGTVTVTYTVRQADLDAGVLAVSVKQDQSPRPIATTDYVIVLEAAVVAP